MDESDLRCPITHEIFLDPVIISDGFTYEREAIEKALNKSKKSPLTNKALSNTTIISNFIIKKTVNIYLEKYPEKKNEQYKLDEPFDLSSYESFIEYRKKISDEEVSKSFKDESFVKKWVDSLNNLDAVNNNGWGLIHYICSNSTPEMIRYIIKKGVDEKVKTADGESILHIINENPSIDIKELLKIE